MRNGGHGREEGAVVPESLFGLALGRCFLAVFQVLSQEGAHDVGCASGAEVTEISTLLEIGVSYLLCPCEESLT